MQANLSLSALGLQAGLHERTNVKTLGGTSSSQAGKGQEAEALVGEY